jgi:flagellar export protein FliJ
MKAFRYRLQAVQRLRDRHEHEATEHYAGALNQRAQASQRLDAAERELAANQAECSRLLDEGVPAGDLRHQQAFGSRLQDQCQAAATQLDQAEAHLNQALGLMVTARRESEAVQKHHDRAQSGHQMEQQREEQKWLDDLPASRTAPGLLG